MINWIKANPLMAGIIATVIVALGTAAILAFFANRRAEAERHDNSVRTEGVQKERLDSNKEILNAVQNSQRPVTSNELERVRNQFDRTRRPNGQ